MQVEGNISSASNFLRYRAKCTCPKVCFTYIGLRLDTLTNEIYIRTVKPDSIG